MNRIKWILFPGHSRPNLGSPDFHIEDEQIKNYPENPVNPVAKIKIYDRIHSFFE